MTTRKLNRVDRMAHNILSVMKEQGPVARLERLNYLDSIVYSPTSHAVIARAKEIVRNGV